MIKLKQKCNEIIKNINKDWVEAINKGAEEDGINLGSMITKTSQYQETLDQAFMEYQERITKKKGGLFS